MTHDGRTARTSTWLATAAEPAVVRRALGTALVVGAMLIAINHGDAIVAGAGDGARALKMALTVIVPYCVSTASSVGAILDRGRQGGGPEAIARCERLPGDRQPQATRPSASAGLVKKGATR
jgi:hypothetical protein